MLAKNVNDNACILIQRVILGPVASKLAPTVVLALHKYNAHKNARHNRAFCIDLLSERGR